MEDVATWSLFAVRVGDVPIVVRRARAFGLQDQTGKASNKWFVNNVVYTP